MTRSRRCGADSVCSRTAARGSRSPPIRSWRRRSVTWSGCTWTRPRVRWSSVSTKRAESRLWTGPRRSCPCVPCVPGRSSGRRMTTSATAPPPCSPPLEIATGKVVDACKPRHRHQEFLAFLKQVARAYPRVQLHVVCDNYSTHKHATVKAWLAKNPRVHIHFTPTSCSWLNLVECFFSIITRQAIRRGTFTSVADLTDAVQTYIDGWNERATPFTWTKPADNLLNKITSAKAKTSGLTVR